MGSPFCFSLSKTTPLRRRERQLDSWSAFDYIIDSPQIWPLQILLRQTPKGHNEIHLCLRCALSKDTFPIFMHQYFVYTASVCAEAYCRSIAVAHLSSPQEFIERSKASHQPLCIDQPLFTPPLQSLL